jgi:hypothetical protein
MAAALLIIEFNVFTVSKLRKKSFLSKSLMVMTKLLSKVVPLLSSSMMPLRKFIMFYSRNG